MLLSGNLIPNRLLNSISTRKIFYMNKQFFLENKTLKFGKNISVPKNLSRYKITGSRFLIFQHVIVKWLRFDLISQNIRILVTQNDRSRINLFISLMNYLNIYQQKQINGVNMQNANPKSMYFNKILNELNLYI